MRKQKPRTYKTLNRAIDYAYKLHTQHPTKTFKAMPDPRAGSFSYVVALLIDPDPSAGKNTVTWALCA